MLNIEKFQLLTVPHLAQLHEVNSLFVTARTALALLEFERTATITLVPADATRAWDYTDPMIRVDESKTPDTVALNDVFAKLGKIHNKRVSSVIGKKKLDPINGVEAEFARQGILTGDAKHRELVAIDALESVQNDLGLCLRGQRDASRQDRILLEVIEAINASALLLGNQQPNWSMQQFSEHVHQQPSGHPIVAQLVAATSSTVGLMEKSKMAKLSATAAA